MSLDVEARSLSLGTETTGPLTSRKSNSSRQGRVQRWHLPRHTGAPLQASPARVLETCQVFTFSGVSRDIERPWLVLGASSGALSGSGPLEWPRARAERSLARTDRKARCPRVWSLDDHFVKVSATGPQEVPGTCPQVGFGLQCYSLKRFAQPFQDSFQIPWQSLQKPMLIRSRSHAPTSILQHSWRVVRHP